MSGSGEETCSALHKARTVLTHHAAKFAFIPRALAFVALIVQFPVLLTVSALVVMTSPGPALVNKAYRRGRADEVVVLYEFRTECWETWRETRVGAFLRAADLHRLPRLLNVLRGDVRPGEQLQALRV